MDIIKITLPPKIHFVVVYNKELNWLILYNDNMIYKIFIRKDNTVFFNKQTNSLILKPARPSCFYNFFASYFKKFLYAWNNYYFAKFKWKGKGFRMFRREKNRFMRYFFGHSHYKMIKFNKSVLLKLNKQKFIVYNISLTTILKIIKSVKKVKPVNLFTKRGLKYTRQIISKRRGKSKTF